MHQASNHSCSLLLFISLLLLPLVVLSSSPSSSTTGVRVGGWQPILDVNDPRVVEVAKFAIDVQNNKAGTQLYEFGKVAAGDYKVIGNGKEYRLFIDAKPDSSKGGDFAVEAHESRSGEKKLLSFYVRRDD